MNACQSERSAIATGKWEGRAIDLEDGVSMTFCHIPAGELRIGSRRGKVSTVDVFALVHICAKTLASIMEWISSLFIGEAGIGVAISPRVHKEQVGSQYAGR